MRNHKLIVLATILISLVYVSCARRRTTNIDPVTVNQQDQPLATTKVLKLVTPEEAKIAIKASAVSTAAFGENFAVPTIHLTLFDSSYFQVLRCDSSFRETFAVLMSRDSDSLESGKWAWFDAFGSTSTCRVAAQRIQTPTFQDITARSGTFFYIINPCVSAERSTSGRDTCSFRLEVTDDISFDGSLAAAFEELAIELVAAEARYNLLTSELNGLSHTLIQQKQICEQSLQGAQTTQREELLKDGAVTALAGALAAGTTLLGARYYLSQRQQKLRGAHVLGIGGVFAAASSLVLALQQESPTNQASATNAACDLMQKTAAHILLYSEDARIERAQDDLIEKSIRMARLDDEFEGYNQTLFTH